MIGLYPITGQTTFLIRSPWFEHLKLDLGNGKELVINSTGGDKDTVIHVQSLKVNGEEWRKSWLTWTDIFANGGTMEFELGPTPDLSYFDAEDPPPSPASSASPPDRRRNIPIIETVTPGGGAVTNGQGHETRAAATAKNEVRFDRRLYGLFGLLLVMPIAGALVLFIWRR
jgi:Glycosyl hydrolase family 92